MAESGALAKVMNCLCIIELSLNCLHMAHSIGVTDFVSRTRGIRTNRTPAPVFVKNTNMLVVKK